jgi:hypothetical protein
MLNGTATPLVCRRALQKKPRQLARAIKLYALQHHFDLAMHATKSGAKFLRALSFQSGAEQLLFRAYSAAPYDHALGEHLADLIYENRQHAFREGTIERGRFLMRLLARSFPSTRVTEAYFRNLRELMLVREQRPAQGQIVLGLGCGRCGSRTLAAVLRSVEGAISTHENPPLVFWRPQPRQVQFHLDRFRIISQYFPLVADCALWWIHLVPAIFEVFPNAKAIGLWRDTGACVRSWTKALPEHINHWVASSNCIWPANAWNPCFPNYDPPDFAKCDPWTARESLIRRYVTEYNEHLRSLAALFPNRMLLLRTEDLDVVATREAISDFVGSPLSASIVRLNVGTITTSDDLYF